MTHTSRFIVALISSYIFCIIQTNIRKNSSYRQTINNIHKWSANFFICISNIHLEKSTTSFFLFCSKKLQKIKLKEEKPEKSTVVSTNSHSVRLFCPIIGFSKVPKREIIHSPSDHHLAIESSSSSSEALLRCFPNNK